jgi:hypothetical protein
MVDVTDQEVVAVPNGHQHHEQLGRDRAVYSLQHCLSFEIECPWRSSCGTTVVPQSRRPQRGEESRRMIPQDAGKTDREQDAAPERQRQELTGPN